VIIFVPAYDEATRANHAIVRRLRATAVQLRLLGDAADTTLVDILRVHPGRPLFAMSHGRPSHFCAQQGAQALNRDHVVDAVVSLRTMYVYACHTASELGALAAQSGSSYWGYTGSISAPPTSEHILPILAPVFEFVRQAFPTTDDDETRGAFLLELRVRCEAATALLDALWDRDVELEVDAYLCLLHLWQRIRGWFPGETQPHMHPEAPAPTLFA
jgi:hypothetical protein